VARERKRRTRQQAAPFAKLLAAQMPAGSEWHLAGSWRRGAAEIGDFDVVVVRRSGTLDGFRFPASFTRTEGGSKRAAGYMAIRGRPLLHVDFWACTRAELGAFLLYSTGPEPLAIRQRTRARRLGMVLNQYGLWRDGVRVRAYTEEAIYRQLKMAYLPPEQREKYARPSRKHSQIIMIPSNRPGKPPHRVVTDGTRYECSCEWWLFKRQDCHAITTARRQIAAGKKKAGKAA